MAERFVALGTRKIRLTGGEPLVRQGIVELCARIAALPGLRELCLTSNGSQLGRLAQPLFDAGVSRLNISLDSLDAERFRSLTRTGDLNQVIAGIDAARSAGFQRTKLNCVVLKAATTMKSSTWCALPSIGNWTSPSLKKCPGRDQRA